MLAADLLPFINRYPDRPLAYNIAWKTTVYVLLSMLFHYLERLVDFWREAGGFIAGNQKLLAEIVWPHFWATLEEKGFIARVMGPVPNSVQARPVSFEALTQKQGGKYDGSQANVVGEKFC